MLCMIFLGCVVAPLCGHPCHAASSPMTVDQQIDLIAINTGLPTDEPDSIIEKIIKFLLSFIGGLSVLIIVIAGFVYVTSAGDENKTEEAKKWIIYAIVGLIVSLLAWVIVNTTVWAQYNPTAHHTPTLFFSPPAVMAFLMRMITFLLGVWSIYLVLLCAFAAVLYFTSGGDEDRMDTAVGMWKKCAVGGCLVVLFFGIVSYIGDALVI